MKSIALVLICISMVSAVEYPKADDIRAAFQIIDRKVATSSYRGVGADSPHLERILPDLSRALEPSALSHVRGKINVEAAHAVIKELAKLADPKAQPCDEDHILRRHTYKFFKIAREFPGLSQPMSDYFLAVQGRLMSRCLREQAHDVIGYFYQGQDELKSQLVDFFKSAVYPDNLMNMPIELTARMFASLMSERGIERVVGGASLPESLVVAMKKNHEIFKRDIIGAMSYDEILDIQLDNFEDQRLALAYMAYESIYKSQYKQKPFEGKWLADELFKGQNQYI